MLRTVHLLAGNLAQLKLFNDACAPNGAYRASRNTDSPDTNLIMLIGQIGTAELFHQPQPHDTFKTKILIKALIRDAVRNAAYFRQSTNSVLDVSAKGVPQVAPRG